MSSIIVRCFEVTTVTTFNVSFNKLKYIPDTIGLLQKLVTLDLRLGYCTTLSLSPLSFSFSSHLSLSLSILLPLYLHDLLLSFLFFNSNNLLEDLPSSLSSCSQLRLLIISFNRFTVLPPVLYDCSSLETLLASDNQITVIDVEGFLKLKSLMTLDLSNNDIAQVPPQLGLVNWLK